jgi:ribosomal protein S18 acetylase RimI-like enzyme
METQITEYSDAHRTWARKLLKEQWGSLNSVTRGNVYRADLLPGYVALVNGEPSGLLTYNIREDQCEIVTLNSLKEGVGIGTMLIQAALEAAQQAGCTRLWLITTNDNLPAVRFYQKRGFELVAVHRGAIAESRRLKPEIPRVGLDGIPIRDEIELEMRIA